MYIHCNLFYLHYYCYLFIFLRAFADRKPLVSSNLLNILIGFLTLLIFKNS